MKQYRTSPSPASLQSKRSFVYSQFGLFVKVQDASLKVVHLCQNKGVVYVVTSLKTDQAILGLTQHFSSKLFYLSVL